MFTIYVYDLAFTQSVTIKKKLANIYQIDRYFIYLIIYIKNILLIFDKPVLVLHFSAMKTELHEI